MIRWLIRKAGRSETRIFQDGVTDYSSSVALGSTCILDFFVNKRGNICLRISGNCHDAQISYCLRNVEIYVILSYNHSQFLGMFVLFWILGPFTVFTLLGFFRTIKSQKIWIGTWRYLQFFCRIAWDVIVLRIWNISPICFSLLPFP